MPPTEQDLLEAIRAGSEQAFEAVFRQHYASLCRYAGQLLPDPDEAEEEVQAMFLALWEKRTGLIITISLKSYLYRAVHNRCMNRLKHTAVREEHRAYTRYVGEASVESPAQTVIGDELASRLEEAIRKLPEQCRLVFTLSRFEELKYSEIADRLGISIKTVENQIGKALRVLRTELSEYLSIALVLLYNVPWMMDNLGRLPCANLLSLGFDPYSSLCILNDSLSLTSL
ncbi:RNA polymerase sigma-70 factor [Spirosoma sp. KNUC1025]|uniref:RNA polymerase sigma-70 factor n=1 Tax=Spirosoma sp. KNUC1025 TaxID=2894082 RepID=UPI003865170F